MTDTPRPDDVGGRVGSAVAILEWGALALLVAAGLTGWGLGIVHRGYDYDEVQRAHSVWLAAQGMRPYSEMFEVHPPYFILLTPILRWQADPCAILRALRLFAAVGNLAFLGGLVALGRDSSTRGGRWAVLGVAFVAGHPKVIDYLIEFRIDGWGDALAVWSIVLFLCRPGARWRFATFGALSGIATLLFCPKLAILPPLVAGCAVLQARPTGREALRSGIAYLLGVGIAGVVFALFLAANRIELDRVYLLLFRYHTLSNAHSAYRYGLLRGIAETPLLVVPIALGALLSAPGAWKRRSPAVAYHLALGIWLVIQALMVAYHYKQYYAPWFLFASAFVILLGRALDGFWRPLGVLGFVAAGGAMIVGALGIAALWVHYSPASRHCAEIRALNVLAGSEDRVVASPPDHPIVRRDVFFLWFNTSDPGGYDSERILEHLTAYRSQVSAEQNRAALRAHPPAFVVLDSGPYAAGNPAGQWRALLEFLPRHGYRVVRLGGLRLALRPDRYDRLRDTGLFEDAPGPLAPVMPSH